MKNPSTNSSQKKIQKRLYTILTIQFLLAFLKFPISLPLGLNELISCFLLFFGIYSKNFCLIAFYCIFLIFHILQYIKILGIKIQKIFKLDENFFEDSKIENFFFFVIFFSLVFDVFFSYLLFRAYKYFKFLSFKGDFGVRDFGSLDRKEEDVNGNEDFKAFQGQGIRLF